MSNLSVNNEGSYNLKIWKSYLGAGQVVSADAELQL